MGDKEFQGSTADLIRQLQRIEESYFDADHDAEAMYYWRKMRALEEELAVRMWYEQTHGAPVS